MNRRNFLATIIAAVAGAERSPDWAKTLRNFYNGINKPAYRWILRKRFTNGIDVPTLYRIPAAWKKLSTGEPYNSMQHAEVVRLIGEPSADNFKRFMEINNNAI